MEHRHQIGPLEPERMFPLSDDVADDSAIGELINDRYAILSRFAEGPTGKLYRSRDVKTETEVTLKLLTGWSGLDDSQIQKLREELSVTRALTGKRASIALVYDCDVTADGRFVLVMEALKGRSLLELIQCGEPLPVERGLHLAFQIAEGLRAAHDLGLVHGALKAEHVLVQGTDTVKVVGFEVARLRAARWGSPRWDLATSPARPNTTRASEGAGVLTEAADTRDVGLLLLEMLQSGVRSGPRGIGMLPPSVKPLVMQALVGSPEASSRNIGALATALSAEIARRPEPLPSAIRRRARPKSRRERTTILGAGVLAVMMTALAVWLTWSLVATPRRPVTAAPQVVPAREATPNPPSPVFSQAMPSQSNEGVARASPDTPGVTQLGPPTPESSVVTAPPPVEATVPQAPRVAPRPVRPAHATPPLAAAGSLPAPAAEVARSAPASDSARSVSEGPDPSAIIDWLIKEKGGF
jgi:Protein kinase domain